MGLSSDLPVCVVQGLRQWAESQYVCQWGSQLATSLDFHNECRWTALAGHASFRQYYRLVHPRAPSCIVMYAPPGREDIGHFVRVARYFRTLGVRGVPVPRVFACDIARGFGLLEDLGTTPLWHAVTAARDDATRCAWYECAISTLLQIQSGPRAASIGKGYVLPQYTRACLEEELAYYPVWFVEKLLGHTVGLSHRQQWHALCDILLTRLQAQPHCPVHRDYHSLNLICRQSNDPAGGIGVLDFQDSVWGPYVYDLVSLLCDAYIVCPDAVWAHCRQYYYDAVKSGLHWQVGQGRASQLTFSEFSLDFDYACLQRHLKIVGIFSRLHLRDGKSHYLQYIPRLMRNISAICLRYSGPIHWLGESVSLHCEERVNSIERDAYRCEQ